MKQATNTERLRKLRGERSELVLGQHRSDEPERVSAEIERLDAEINELLLDAVAAPGPWGRIIYLWPDRAKGAFYSDGDVVGGYYCPMNVDGSPDLLNVGVVETTYDES